MGGILLDDGNASKHACFFLLGGGARAVPESPVSRFLLSNCFVFCATEEIAYSDISDSESESASRSRFAAAEIMVTSVFPPIFIGAGLYVPSSLAIASDFVFA